VARNQREAGRKPRRYLPSTSLSSPSLTLLTLSPPQLGLLFQIITEAGSILWDKLELPEGRTRKACEIMISNEKQKVKKAREAKANGEETPTPNTKVRALC